MEGLLEKFQRSDAKVKVEVKVICVQATGGKGFVLKFPDEDSSFVNEHLAAELVKRMETENMVDLKQRRRSVRKAVSDLKRRMLVDQRIMEKLEGAGSRIQDEIDETANFIDCFTDPDEPGTEKSFCIDLLGFDPQNED